MFTPDVYSIVSTSQVTGELQAQGVYIGKGKMAQLLSEEAQLVSEAESSLASYKLSLVCIVKRCLSC